MPKLLNMRKIFLAILVVSLSGAVVFIAIEFILSSQKANGANAMVTAVAQINATLTARAKLDQVVFELYATQTALAPTAIPTSFPSNTPAPTNTPTPEPSLGATRISPLDSMVIVYIPSGSFLMGTDNGAEVQRDEEKPQRTIYLDGYWIDQTLVTNGDYHRCMDAGKCNGLVSTTKYYSIFMNQSYTNHPVVYVTWFDAEKYCAWVGGSLPTEAQWEKAARGTDGRLYPWGNAFPDSKLANYDGILGMTSMVGSFPKGASPYGVMDMAGNVRQWIKDWYSDNYLRDAPDSNPTGPDTGTAHTLKGGSWNDPEIYLRSASRLSHVPDSPGETRGFRCVRSGN
jgi:formylglycine-generating enzyme required for sulfatase activity